MGHVYICALVAFVELLLVRTKAPCDLALPHLLGRLASFTFTSYLNH